MSVVKKYLEIEMREMQCGTCGTPFSMPEKIYQSCYEDGGFFSCPLGHSRGWNKGNKVVRREHADLERKLSEQMRIATKQAERAAKAEQEIKKMKKRASAGVCPCCNRTFQQLARHMKLKHPEHAE